MGEAAYFKEADGIGYVRAEGHMTALLCPSIKARIVASLESDSPLKRVAFDLTACDYMDSTFLGLIVGVYKRFAAGGGAKPILYGANEACVGLLRTLGVLGLVELATRPAPALQGMELVDPHDKPSARFILDAHEQLSDLSDQNRARFAPLSSALRGAIEAESGKNKKK